jgi:hypothetical protein
MQQANLERLLDENKEIQTEALTLVYSILLFIELKLKLINQSITIQSPDLEELNLKPRCFCEHRTIESFAWVAVSVAEIARDEQPVIVIASDRNPVSICMDEVIVLLTPSISPDFSILLLS